MKKSIFTFLLVLSVFTLYAQTDAGKLIIGGDGGFSFSKDKFKSGNTTVESYAYRSLYLNPNVGYFIIDQLAVGGKINYATYTTIIRDRFPSINEDGKVNLTQFTIGPWARYYFLLGTKSAVFGEASTGFGFQSRKEKQVGNGRVVTERDPSHRLVQFAVGPGYTYFLNENIGIEALLLLKVDKNSFRPERSNDRVGTTNVGGFVNIGFQIYS